MGAGAEPGSGAPGAREDLPPPVDAGRRPSGARPPPLPPRVSHPVGPVGPPTEDVGFRARADAYVPVLPPRRPRWWALLLGLALTALGLWLVIDVVPGTERRFEAAKTAAPVEKEPDPFGIRSRRIRTFFDEEDETKYWVDGSPMGASDVEALRTGAWLVLVVGLAMTLLLGSRRPGRPRFCDVCGRDVIAVPRRGWRCERCNTKL